MAPGRLALGARTAQTSRKAWAEVTYNMDNAS
jgi:hypothetical protein